MRNGRAPFPVGLFLLVTVALTTPAVTAQSAPQYYRQGREALREGIPEQNRDLLLQGADSFRRALNLNTRYADARVGLAEALIWLGDYEQAGEQIRLARELRYTGISLDLLEARLLVLTDRVNEARQLYRTVLRREPYNVEGQVGSAILALSEGLTESTVDRLRVLERRFPENRQLLAALVELSWIRGDMEQMERYLAAALHYHGDIPAVQIVAARLFLERGDAVLAEYHARNAASLAPHLEEGWMLLARSVYRQGRYEEALTHYEQLITLDPENHRAWFARGVLAAGQGDTRRAYASWERAQRIRPDYELAAIARESTLIMAEPLDSELRAAAARAYRRTGRELEERFLHRQAERHYRRGLQIYPFDSVLRRSLADLYLARDLWGRYLQELEILAELRGDDRELRERIETYRRLRRDSLAQQWDVDQFTAPRARSTIALFHVQDPRTVEPGADEYIARYLASLLQTSQNITIAAVREGSPDPVESLSRARREEAQLALLLDVHVEEHRVSLGARLLEERTGGEIFSGTVAREGVNRIERALRDLAGEIIAGITPVGTVLDRRFERVLISLGTVDGLEVEDEIIFTRDPRGVSIGHGTVLMLDDLLAEVRYVPEGPDTLTVGRYARRRPDDPAEPAPPLPPEPEQLSRVHELLKQLFRLP